MVPKGTKKTFEDNDTYFDYPFHENVSFFESIEEAKAYIK